VLLPRGLYWLVFWVEAEVDLEVLAVSEGSVVSVAAMEVVWILL